MTKNNKRQKNPALLSLSANLSLSVPNPQDPLYASMQSPYNTPAMLPPAKCPILTRLFL